MFKFPNFQAHELLGITPVAQITDKEIWNALVTPQTKALLGSIRAYQIEVRETVSGNFPGDHVSNLNKHLLYGGESGYVRFPYIVSTYETSYGALIIKRDGLKFQATGWLGDLEKDNVERIFMTALRDRRYDGSKRSNDTALLDRSYDDPTFNHPLQINGMPKNSRCVDLSIYSSLPGSSVKDITGDTIFDHFIQRPFHFIDNPEIFLNYFRQAWKGKRAPGQNYQPIPDFAILVANALDQLATKHRYDFIENCSSHYHVAKFSNSLGYKYAKPEDAETIQKFTEAIKRLKHSGITLTRSQESWLCVLQNLPRQYIPEKLYLGGTLWPQDNIRQKNLWLFKPISERAKLLHSESPASPMTAVVKSRRSKTCSSRK